MHINLIELSAVLFGVKCFGRSHNCLAVAYINNWEEWFLSSMQFLNLFRNIVLNITVC